MNDKSPRQSSSKKSTKSIKEKRADKRAKASGDDAGISIVNKPKGGRG